MLCSKPRLLITALSCPFEPTEGHFSLLDDFHQGPLPASIIRRVCREIIDVERVEILAGILGSPCQTLVPWARLTSPAFCSTGMVSLEETVMSIPLSLPTQFPSPGMPSPFLRSGKSFSSLTALFKVTLSRRGADGCLSPSPLTLTRWQR